jgi:hypothetical protein
MKLLIMQFSPVSYHFLLGQRSSSAPYSQKHSAYILPVMSETKFHTYIEYTKFYFSIL